MSEYELYDRYTVKNHIQNLEVSSSQKSWKMRNRRIIQNYSFESIYMNE